MESGLKCWKILWLLSLSVNLSGGDKIGVIVLDKSGSMGEYVCGGPHSNRLEKAKQVIKDYLVNELPDGSFSGMVFFDLSPDGVFPLVAKDEISEERLERDLRRVRPGGGTCFRPAIELVLQDPGMLNGTRKGATMLFVTDGENYDVPWCEINEEMIKNAEELELRVIEAEIGTHHEDPSLEKLINRTNGERIVIDKNIIKSELKSLLHNAFKTREEIEQEEEERKEEIKKIDEIPGYVPFSSVYLPVGSIIPWLGGTLAKVNLPGNWQYCDGSEIILGPMKGQKTPNLNEYGRFLRGTEERLDEYMYQEAMLGDHEHEIYDPGHSHSDRGHSHSYEDYGKPNWEGDDSNDRGMVRPEGRSRRTGTSYADIMSSKTGMRVKGAEQINSYCSTSQIGQETRPANMLIRWIIKIK